ncbi:MAG TPA: hypothetical protein VN455_08030 [Methanotrichaceae archaeon]|nr:hypothetical protein [Methanotrichaceae archaeon]
MRYGSYLLAALLVAATCVIGAYSADTANTSEEPQAQVSQDQPVPGDLLYSEDFSSSKSGWTYTSDEYFKKSFKNGIYHLTIVPPDYWNWVSGPSRLNFTDFILEVEATKEAGPDDNVFGLLVRKVDVGNYYAFLLSSDGYYQIAKRENNSWSYASEWTKSDAIKTGNSTNLIKITGEGDRLALYANDVKLTDYNDSSFAYGGLGLYVGTQSEGNVTIGFDNLKVWSIKE